MNDSFEIHENKLNTYNKSDIIVESIKLENILIEGTKTYFLKKLTEVRRNENYFIMQLLFLIRQSYLEIYEEGKNFIQTEFDIKHIIINIRDLYL